MTMKLNFSVDMKGAEDIERTLNRLTQKLNETGGATDKMASSISGDLGRLGEHLNKMITQGSGFDKLVEGMGDAGKAIQRNFATSLDIVSKTIKTAIDKMQKDIGSLTTSISAEYEKLEHLKQTGNTKEIMETENRIVGMQGKQAAMLSQVESVKKAVNAADLISKPAAATVAGAGASGSAATNAMAGMMNGGGSAAMLRAAGPYGAAAYLGYRAIDALAMQPGLAYQQELLRQDTSISEMSRQSRLRSGAISGGVVGFEMERRGVGLVKEFENTATTEARDAKLSATVESVKNFITTLGGTIGVRRDSSVVEQDIKTQLQQRQDALTAPLEQMSSTVIDVIRTQSQITKEFGQQAGKGAFTGLMGTGLDAQSVAQGMAPFARQGVLANKNDLETVVATQFGGIAGKMAEEIAKLTTRQAHRGDARDTNTILYSIQGLLKDIGLGDKGSLAAQRLQTESWAAKLNERLSSDAKESMGTLALSSRIMSNINRAHDSEQWSPMRTLLTPIEKVELGQSVLSTFEGMQKNPLTAVGMVDEMTLMKAGVTQPIARQAYREMGLDNPETWRRVIKQTENRDATDQEIQDIIKNQVTPARQNVFDISSSLHGLDQVKDPNVRAMLDQYLFTGNLKTADAGLKTGKSFSDIALEGAGKQIPLALQKREDYVGGFEATVKDGRVSYGTEAAKVDFEATFNSQVLAINKMHETGINVVDSLLKASKELTVAMEDAVTKVTSAVKGDRTIGTQVTKEEFKAIVPDSFSGVKSKFMPTR